MARSVLLALAGFVAICGSARADEATAWAETAYKISASVEPGALRAGEKAKLRLAIIPTAEDAKVHPEAPIKVRLSGPEAVKLQKDRLGRADGKLLGRDFRFEVAAEGAQAGSGEVVAKVDFFICSERWCVRQQARATAPVRVCAKDQKSC